jgi:hypothetical protein
VLVAGLANLPAFLRKPERQSVFFGGEHGKRGDALVIRGAQNDADA